jgi:hypothetical protein
MLDEPALDAAGLRAGKDAGDYRIIDDQAPATATINANVKSGKLLGRVNVGVGASPGSDVKAVLTHLLPRARRHVAGRRSSSPPPTDLANGLRLSAFVRRIQPISATPSNLTR